MNKPTVAPYGAWRSPITPDLITQSSIRLGEPRVDRKGDGSLYWLEMRPEEGGRYVIVRRSLDGEIRDVLPRDFNARTFVHEYGGGSWMVDNKIVYFTNFNPKDQPHCDRQIWRIMPGKQPEQLTHSPGLRFTDMVMDTVRNRIICVCEDHTDEESGVVNFIGAVSLKDGTVSKIHEGADFYSSPRLSPEGKFLCFISWNHPNMPWDKTTLSVVFAEDGRPASTIDEQESIVEPQWSLDGGFLLFISDKTGYWNLYSWNEEEVRTVCPMEAECIRPHWVFGESHYGFTDDGRIVFTFTKNGTWKLGVVAMVPVYGDSGALEIFNLPYTEISCVQAHGKDVYFLAGSPSEPESLVQMNLDTEEMKVIKRSSSAEVDPGYISFPESIVFPTTDGTEAYGLYYPPTNKDFTAPDKESPLLLVMAHGGPTSAAKTTMALAMVQYWTSRGFGVVDVNYRGSTGYGREYRNLLHDSWGVVDVDDCVNAARYLAEKGLVDGDRLCIRGWSAGGYTTLAALAFRPGVFAAGASHFGVSDAELLAKLTHKFEARYLDRLIGRYPEQAELYRERSPIHSIGNISSPTILFQGLEDKIVLPEQAKDMFNALVQKGVPTSLVLFEGEGHGFRGEEAIKQTLRDELSFYSQVFGFELADPVPPVKIENL